MWNPHQATPLHKRDVHSSRMQCSNLCYYSRRFPQWVIWVIQAAHVWFIFIFLTFVLLGGSIKDIRIEQYSTHTHCFMLCVFVCYWSKTTLKHLFIKKTQESNNKVQLILSYWLYIFVSYWSKPTLKHRKTLTNNIIQPIVSRWTLLFTILFKKSIISSS